MISHKAVGLQKTEEEEEEDDDLLHPASSLNLSPVRHNARDMQVSTTYRNPTSVRHPPHVRELRVCRRPTDDDGDEAISTHGTNYVIPAGRRPGFIRNPVRR